jgi:intergrase/recombinase
LDEIRDEFVKWLKNKNLSKSYIKDLVGTFDKEVRFLDLSDIDSIREYLESLNSKTMAVNSLRAVCNFLEYKGAPKEELTRIRTYLKSEKGQSDNFVPSDKQVIEALLKINDKRFRTMFLIFAYSGIRGTELVKMVREFDKDKLIINGTIAKYQLFYSRGMKNNYYVYMPKHLAEQLHKFYIHGDTISHNFSKAGLAPKYLRKWLYNFLIYNNVPESVADFIEGRSANTVGSMHYLARAKQADHWYGLVVDKLKETLEPTNE